MKKNENYGEYSRSFITDTPADLTSEEAQHFKKILPKFPEEAIYIYSFVRNRLVYADGWEDILGYKDTEINMATIVGITCAEHKPFSYELNDKALIFIQSKYEELEKYSFSIELKKMHKLGEPVPLISRVGVFKAVDKTVHEIIGRSQINRSIKFGKVMQYSAYGPEKAKFEEALNKALFKHYAISAKEKEALALAAQGYSYKQIAHQFKVSPSAIEKRIIPLYKRFDVQSLAHLISFAYENHILP